MLFLTAAAEIGVHTEAIFCRIRASTASAAAEREGGVMLPLLLCLPCECGPTTPPPSLRDLLLLPGVPADAALLRGLMPTSGADAPPNRAAVSLHTLLLLPPACMNLPPPLPAALLRGSPEKEVRGVTNMCCCCCLPPGVPACCCCCWESQLAADSPLASVLRPPLAPCCSAAAPPSLSVGSSFQPASSCTVRVRTFLIAASNSSCWFVCVVGGGGAGGDMGR